MTTRAQIAAMTPAQRESTLRSWIDAARGLIHECSPSGAVLFLGDTESGPAWLWSRIPTPFDQVWERLKHAQADRPQRVISLVSGLVGRLAAAIQSAAAPRQSRDLYAGVPALTRAIPAERDLLATYQRLVRLYEVFSGRDLPRSGLVPPPGVVSIAELRGMESPDQQALLYAYTRQLRDAVRALSNCTARNVAGRNTWVACKDLQTELAPLFDLFDASPSFETLAQLDLFRRVFEEAGRVIAEKSNLYGDVQWSEWLRRAGAPQPHGIFAAAAQGQEALERSAAVSSVTRNVLLGGAVTVVLGALAYYLIKV